MASRGLKLLFVTHGLVLANFIHQMRLRPDNDQGNNERDEADDALEE